MAQRVRALTTKPYNLSSIPNPHDRRKESTPENCFLTWTGMPFENTQKLKRKKKEPLLILNSSYMSIAPSYKIHQYHLSLTPTLYIYTIYMLCVCVCVKFQKHL